MRRNYKNDKDNSNSINILKDKGNNYCVYIDKGNDDENDNDNKKWKRHFINVSMGVCIATPGIN